MAQDEKKMEEKAAKPKSMIVKLLVGCNWPTRDGDARGEAGEEVNVPASVGKYMLQHGKAEKL